jgi:hypothetical protein
MRSLDVQAAVEELLGESVPRGTVKQALSAGVLARPPRFRRTARATYVLISRVPTAPM